jgi:hypothetical protein
MKRILLITILALTVNTAQSQTSNPRKINPSGISLYAVGPNLIGSVCYDYFITPYLNAEAGIGFIGVHGGLKVHLWGGNDNKKWTPYFGASITRSLFPSAGVDYLPYFPIGIHYVGEKRFNFAFEVAPFQIKMLAWNVVGAKFGYRF